MLSRDERLKRVEELLRARGPALLSPEFQRNIMRAVGRLPDPQLTAPVRGLPGIAKTLRLFSAGELAAGALIAAGALLALLPGTGSALEGWHWELASLDLRLSIGGMVLSGSLLSIVAVALGSVFVAGVGAYASRHHLIGA